MGTLAFRHSFIATMRGFLFERGIVKLIINHAFKNLLPSLSEEEHDGLRSSIHAEGCRDPLVVWRGQIIDGHNRYEICESEGIDFSVVEMEFADDDAAMDWIDKNQIARRNLTPDDFRLAVGRRYNRTKKDAHAGVNQHSSVTDKMSTTTAETIAAESGVDERTVRRAGKLADAVESVQHNEPEIAAQGRPAVIDRAKEILKPHVANNSGDNEWYTPKTYVEAARAVMGGIDTDPASHEEANKVVNAVEYFTTKDDGLKQEWLGRVWLNPPYEGKLIVRFMDKLAESVKSGDTTEATVLVNNATETRWFACLASLSACLCFPTGRIKFWHPRKESVPLQGQCIAYIGENTEKFISEFHQFGIVTTVQK